MCTPRSTRVCNTAECVCIHAYMITTHLTINAFDDQHDQQRIWRSTAHLMINSVFDDQQRVWRSTARLTINSTFDDQQRVWRSTAHLTINNTFVVWWRMRVFKNVHICKATLEAGVYACVCECVWSLMCTFCTVQQCACIVCLHDHNTVVVCNLVQLISQFIHTHWAWEDN